MTMLRSLLFVPGDSERKLTKADECRADAVIIDLEDAVAPTNKPAARTQAADFVRERNAGARDPALWVRINALDSGHAIDDLDAIIATQPDGIMLPKANGPQDAAQLSDWITQRERSANLPLGGIRIMPVATETPIAPFRLGDYATAGLDRLAGLTWGAEDLAAALGASSNRGEHGEWSFTYQLVRSLTLMAAHAASVQAIDTVFIDFRDQQRFIASCRSASNEGFSGCMAIHPAQVDIINDAFTPSAEKAAHAQTIIDAFAAQPDAGVIAIEGKMFDLPHLRQARQTLAVWTRFKG